jgi:hypothetical protein
LALIPLVFLGGLLQLDKLRDPVGRFVDDLDASTEKKEYRTLIGRVLSDPEARILYFRDSHWETKLLKLSAEMYSSLEADVPDKASIL